MAKRKRKRPVCTFKAPNRRLPGTPEYHPCCHLDEIPVFTVNGQPRVLLACSACMLDFHCGAQHWLSTARTIIV